VENFQIEEFDVNISVDAITPALLWESRFVEFERSKKSQRIYSDMTPEHRMAINERIKRATAVMYDTVEDWVPDSLNLSDDGTCIKIEFNLVLAKIDIDVENKNKATTFKLMEVKREIENLLLEGEE
jgi:SHS2 domain-containing protein